MNSNKKRIIENIFSLAALNGINMVIPLVTLPYLIRTLGLEFYGAYSIVYAMLQYGILISAYGFSFSTTQQIAQNKENQEYVSHVFNSTIVARMLLALLSVIVLSAVCLIWYPIQYFYMLLMGLGIIIGDILNPTWLYQGMEKMRFMTIINLISKSVFTILIFIFIRRAEDYLYVTFLNSLGFLIAGLVSLVFACKVFKVKVFIPERKHIKTQFKEGWYIFLSTIFMTLYRNSNIFILGFFVSPAAVGIYSGAEKVIKAFQAIISPISNALFPFVAKTFKTSAIPQKLAMIKRVALLLSLPLLALSIAAYFGTPLIDDILLDGIGEQAIFLIRIMIPVIFFGGLNYILGLVGLVNMGEKKAFFNFVMISGIISLAVLIIAVKPLGINSAGYAMSLTEIVLFALCLWKLIRIRNVK